MVSGSYWPNRESWLHYWPAGIIALIATIQLIMSFAILIIHIAIVPIGIAALCNEVTPRYIMGFVCWAFFFACWISTFCVTCCNRSSVGCATYVLIKNILAFIFSAVLIDFDRKFLDNPYYDYSVSSLFGSSGTSCIFNSDGSSPDFWYISLSLTKGQLAATVIILVTSFVYIGIYIYVYIQALRDNGRISSNTFSLGAHRSPTQPNVITVQPPSYVPEPPIDYNPASSHSHNKPETIICPRCRATISLPERF